MAKKTAQAEVRARTPAEVPIGEGTIRMLLDQITDKWSILILAALCPGPKRFNEIKRELTGVTQKALTQTLRRLERNGLVARRVIPASQVAVEYSVTPLGRTLEKPFRALHTWTVEYAAEVLCSQKEFDKRGASDF